MAPKKNDQRLLNSLLSIIAMMQHKAKDRGLRPVITISKLTDLLKVAGMTVSYQQIVDLTKDPMIAGSVKDINKNQITLNIDGETEPEAPDVEEPTLDQEPLGAEPAPEPVGGEFGEEPVPATQPAPYGQPEQQVTPGPNVVSQMAKRAASRA